MLKKALVATSLIVALATSAYAKPEETVLHSFGAAGDGQHPHSGLLVGKDGAFYGTTLHGGPTGLGIVFRLTAGGEEKVLYNFTGASKGAFPVAGVVMDRKGNLYGTSQGGDISSDFGTIFRMSPNGRHERELHVFGNVPDGNSPQSELLELGNGDFYGVAGNGASGAGAVFKITSAGEYSVVYSFLGGVDGANPSANLVTGNDGDFLSTTQNGGEHASGTVFKLTTT